MPTLSSLKSRILWQDESLIAVNKNVGELVVSAPDNAGKTPIYDALREEFPELRVVHRLDVPTSGVVLFAKNPLILDKILNSKFAGWEKIYEALVAGKVKLDQGTINKKLPAREGDKSLIEAITHYKVLERFADATLVELDMETGRKHQIRLHMAAIGHPLILDPLYSNSSLDRAFKQKYKARKLFLHAARLSFTHPLTKETIHLEAPRPEGFEKILKILSK